jgi:hypothetical protein
VDLLPYLLFSRRSCLIDHFRLLLLCFPVNMGGAAAPPVVFRWHRLLACSYIWCCAWSKRLCARLLIGSLCRACTGRQMWCLRTAWRSLFLDRVRTIARGGCSMPLPHLGFLSFCLVLVVVLDERGLRVLSLLPEDGMEASRADSDAVTAQPAQPNAQRKAIVLIPHPFAHIPLITTSFLSILFFHVRSYASSPLNPLPHIVSPSLPLPIPQILHLIHSHQTPLHATAQVALAQLTTLGRIDAASGFQAAQVLFH